jgi:hypothetical protein
MYLHSIPQKGNPVNRSKLFRLLLLPLMGALLGLACAHIRYTGLLQPWQQVGSLGEPVRRIIGVQDGNKLLVETATGAAFSFAFTPQGISLLPSKIIWERQAQPEVDAAVSLGYSGADFITLPPRFEVRQVYMHEYIYKVEGKGEAHFALDEDGNVWLWAHRIAGLTGLVYTFYPAFGGLAGLALALGIWGVGRFKTRSKGRRGIAPGI